MNAALPSRISFEDYFELEVASEEKHEWSDGAIYAMSRGTPEHARLAVGVAAVLRDALPKDCKTYGSDAMLYVEPAKLSTYADASVVCGPLETKKVIKNGRPLGDAVTNPVVIVEVLSESTERYDRENKFHAYKQLESFREYVLFSQTERSVEVYRRDADAGWTVETAKAGGSVTIHGARIAVDDIYR